VQIADVSRMFVDVQVDETDIAFIQTGQKVDVTLDAYPSEIFEGTVTRIDPQAVVEQNVTVVYVRVEIENPDARLKPGMNATCEFVVDRKEDVLMVPSEAVKEQDGKYYVQVMEGGKPVRRDVEIGLEGNDTTEIVSGLQEGVEVVTQVIQPRTQAQGSGGPPRGMGFPMFGGPPMRMR
jgi:RND family efflux transporter MFP subunit